MSGPGEATSCNAVAESGCPECPESGVSNNVTSLRAAHRIEDFTCFGRTFKIRNFSAEGATTSEGAAPNKDSRGRFGWFVRNRWYPLKDADWKPETARDKKCIIQKDLLDPFENIPLEEFDKFQLQVHLNNLAKTRSKDRVLQIKAYMRAIFAEADDQEFLAKDPARNVKGAGEPSGYR